MNNVTRLSITIGKMINTVLGEINKDDLGITLIVAKQKANHLEWFAFCLL